ncbi:MAG TPA: transposase [Rectinema sp.]|jgi:transposase-like protein|nr:transposase [Rectinema sp.]
MENNQKKPRRVFTPQQKFEIIKDIERASTVREGLAQHGIPSSMFYKWKRQLAVGVNASLRNTKPLKSPDLKKLEEDNRKLKELVLNQSLTIMNLKKEMSLD